MLVLEGRVKRKTVLNGRRFWFRNKFWYDFGFWLNFLDFCSTMKTYWFKKKNIMKVRDIRSDMSVFWLCFSYIFNLKYFGVLIVEVNEIKSIDSHHYKLHQREWVEFVKVSNQLLNAEIMLPKLYKKLNIFFHVN